MERELRAVKEGARKLASCSGSVRTAALILFAQLILKHQEKLLAANKKDIQIAKREGLSEVLLKRLVLSEEKVSDIVNGIRVLSKVKDPIGTKLSETLLDKNLVLKKIAVPIGVLAVIFESRPDVIPQILSLALRSGNAVVLKGGKEATHTNRAFIEIVRRVSKTIKVIPPTWAILVEGRAAARKVLHYPQYVDLVIPRGSNALVQSIMKESEIPVLGHADGICHLFVHRSAKYKEALPVIIDAKAQYPAACNAVETVLVDSAIAKKFLPLLQAESKRAGITLVGCATSKKILPPLKIVRGDAWATEYSSLTLAVKIVSDVDEAISHINHYGSHHTDGILGKDKRAIERFLSLVDSSSVFVNCSTRFADGYRYGLGAEVGISTGKIHARGPVGIEGLLTYQYQLFGKGQGVAQYSGKNGKSFLHRRR